MWQNCTDTKIEQSEDQTDLTNAKHPVCPNSEAQSSNRVRRWPCKILCLTRLSLKGTSLAKPLVPLSQLIILWKNSLQHFTASESSGRSFILGAVTCWSPVLVNTVRPATRVLWDGSVAVTKENPSKFVDVCCVCSETFSSVKNKPYLLLGHDLSVRPDYALALKTLQEELHRETGYPKSYVGAVTCFCDVTDVAKLFFKNVRGFALLAAVLATVPATALHFDTPRQSAGGHLRLSGVVRLPS